jgi:hypothetical protein
MEALSHLLGKRKVVIWKHLGLLTILHVSNPDNHRTHVEKQHNAFNRDLALCAGTMVRL